MREASYWLSSMIREQLATSDQGQQLTNRRPDLYTPDDRHTSNPVSPHRAHIVDGVPPYIEWAIGAGFGVVDVNIPQKITTVDSETLVDYDSRVTDAARLEGEKLISYLYTNYIEPSEASSVVLMGVGNAFHAIAKLLSESDIMYQHIAGVVGFIGINPVRPVASNSWVTSWFRQNSLVYVTDTHALWSKEGKKVSKRYGDLRRAKGNTAHDIMLKNQKEAMDWIQLKVRDDDETEEDSDGKGEEQVKVIGNLAGQGNAAPVEGGLVPGVKEDEMMSLDRKSF